MRISTPGKTLLPIAIAVACMTACVKDDISTLTPVIPDESFVEEFDTASAAADRGWRYMNVSDPYGSSFWTQGMFNNPTITGFPAPVPFPAWSSKGSYTGFIGADYLSTSAGEGVISNWVVSPVKYMKTGDTIIFYSRSIALAYDYAGNTDSSDFANRLQVRLSMEGESLNVGKGADPGDFIVHLLDINPSYKEYHVIADPVPGDGFDWSVIKDPEAYPQDWTRFVVPVRMPEGSARGRFAFRYFLENGGFQGRGTCVAIDSVAYISGQ